ncbi:MAG TPA: helix-turn-helix transcriptional regulator [Solirubrobacteraceae bacterium]
MAKTDQPEIAEQIQMFGENLRRARGQAGYTQAQLSVAAPLDRAAISRLECGERAPDLATLLRICAALGILPQDLLSGIGPGASLRRTPTQTETEPGAQFGANLKWARSRAGISQERLALDAKVDRAAISVYENGGREPNLRTVLKLALKLDIRPDFLLEGIGAAAQPLGPVVNQPL